MKKILFVCLLSIISSIANAQTIHFAMEASYPPFEYIDASNTIQGFDVDIAKALCKEMNATCTFSNEAFDSLIPSLKFKKIDAIISTMDITAAREKQVAFTHPYYHNATRFVSRKGLFNSIDQLKGKRVGVQNGTTHQLYLAAKHPEIIAVPYSSYQNALLDLKNSRLDAVFGDSAVINWWLKQDKTLAPIGKLVTDPTYFATGLGIAVNKKNIQLLNELNQALENIKHDGTYQKIYRKWFPEDHQ